MAPKRKVKVDIEVVAKSVDPYRYRRLVCRWRRPLLGVVPRRSTQVDHIAKVLVDEMAREARVAKRQRPSQAAHEAATLDALEVLGIDVESLKESEASEVMMPMSQRQQYLEEALEDPNLDDDAKAVIAEALRELTIPEIIVKTVLRMTNTFPIGQNGNFVVIPKWFYGGLKLAIQHDLNIYRDHARELVRGCVSVEPAEIDLGTAKPDAVVEANVPLPSTRPGEAQATIKRFHMVDPHKHGKGEFEIVVKVLDSPYATEVDTNVQRLFMIVGNCGLGGDRPNYGTFDVVSCVQIKDGKSSK